jgi:hypothetical protein
MYERTEEVKKLIDIINSIFAIDMTAKRRQPIFVQARMVYARLLRNKGYTLKYIGKTIGKDHATIIHYLGIIDMDLKHDNAFRDKFNKVSSMFFEDYDPIHNLDINQLKNKIFCMRNEINELYLENKFITNKYDSLKDDNARLLPIINLIREKTLIGTEHIVVKKLNALLNSIN